MTTTNDYPVWRQRLSFILDFLIVFELIINTHSVYYFALDRDYYTLYVLTGLICLQLVVLPTVFAWEHLKKLLPVAVAWSAYIIIYAVVSGGDIKRLLAKFIILLVILFVYFYGHMVRGTIKQLFKHYIDVMFVIALISIFMWLTCSVLKWFPATSPFRIEWGADRRIWSFYGIYFHWQNDFFIHGMRFYRNIGIFTEAPMFSLHLCTALMFDLMINDHHTKFRWFRILWFCGTILTTFSITGYLFMMALIVINLYATLIVRARSEDEATAKKAKKQLIVVTVLGIALAAIGLMLIADKLASRSGGSRTEDFRNGYKGWRDHVWFGAGFGDIEARLQYASWRRQHRSNTGFTNSPMAILCEGGIWFFMGYYLSFVYGLFASLHKRDWRAFICLCLMVFLFITTTMEHTAYIISFIAFMMASGLTGALNGVTATNVSIDGEDIAVKLSLSDYYAESIENMKQIVINGNYGTPVTVGQIASFEFDNSPANITRYNQSRYFIVNAAIQGDSLSAASDQVQAMLDAYPFPDGYSYEIQGLADTMMEMFGSLFKALIVAIALVFLVLAAQFESMTMAFIVMMAIPFAMTGAFIAMFLTGTKMSLTSLLGLVLLVGTVVNSSILLVEFINQNKQAMGREDALVAAGKQRLRPILMTTLTTLVGMIPLSLGYGEGGEILAPMGISIIGGLLTSTLLTLIVIPCMYKLVEERRDRSAERSAARAAEIAALEAKWAEEDAKGN